MESIRNTILLFFILLFFILLIYYYSIYNRRRDTPQSVKTKEPFSTSPESITPVEIGILDTKLNTNTNVKEGSSYLKPWYKRACSCAEGFETLSDNTFNFYKYNKESRNANYQPKGPMELENVDIHPQTKMFYYHFSYKLKEYMNIRDKIQFDATSGATICFWLRIHNLYYNSDTMTILSLNLGGVNNVRIAVNSAGLYLTLNNDTGYYIHNFRELGTNNHTWNHIAWTMSAETSEGWNVYYNGVLHKTIQNQGFPVSISADDYVQVIGTDTAYNEFLEGDLGDLQIKNQVLDANQIQDIYKNPTLVNGAIPNNNIFPISIGSNNAIQYNAYSGKTWWGSGIILEENQVLNQQECEDICSGHAHCSGATYNPDKQYCWAVKGMGEGKITPGLGSDYALIPSGTGISL